jgi:hypothetical protein
MDVDDVELAVSEPPARPGRDPRAERDSRHGPVERDRHDTAHCLDVPRKARRLLCRGQHRNVVTASPQYCGQAQYVVLNSTRDVE